MTETKLDRRKFIQAAGAGVALAGTVAATGCAPKAPPAATAEACPDQAEPTQVYRGCAPHLPDNRGFAYFGEPGKKPAQKFYHKFQNTPATVIDYGLTPEQEERARELHKTLHIFDAEFEVSYYEGLLDNMLAGAAACVGGSHTIGALCFELHNGRSKPDIEIKPTDWWSRETFDRDLLFLDRMVAAHPDKVKLCYSYADLMTARKEGKIAWMIDSQNTRFINGDLNALDHYYQKGLRRCQLSYNRQEMVATGCMEPQDSGVSTFGKEVIARMNELNMLVDVGHCSSKTLLDAIELSKAPIVCSHAGLRAIAPSNPRTHTDEGLKKLADSGGVLGVVGVPGTLIEGSSKASVKDFVNAIDYAVKVMGIDHVGFALDQIQTSSQDEFFTAPEWPPEAIAAVSVTTWPWSDTFEGMENHSGYPNLTRGLIWKGYSDEDIRKIMGENHMRLVKEVIG